jgi:lipid II:glycine glycyltransferase (peptidoglycan interpeptide bridge formation enzyme)
VSGNLPYQQAVKALGDHSVPIYFQPWYLDANCGPDNWEGMVYYHRGRPIAIMPFYKRSKWGLRLIDMPHFTKYMGPWVAESYRSLRWESKIFKFFLDHLPKAILFRQNFHPMIKNWMPFYWEGFRQTTAYTYRLDRQTPEELWEGLNRNIRRNINGALQRGITIRDSDDLKGFYRLNESSFKRQGLAIPYSYELLDRHDQALSLREKSKLLIAQNSGGELVAGCYLMIDGDTVYYHLSGEDTSFRSDGGGILLLWNAILWAFAQENIQFFDFEGSMIHGVASIRRQFGAYQVPYFKLYKLRFSWMELLIGR